MIHQIILIIIILLFTQIVSSKRDEFDRQLSDRKFSHAVWVIIVIMAALRKPIEGTDVMGYMLGYMKTFGMSFRDVLAEEKWQDYMGFYFTSKVFSLTRLPYQFWFGFIEGLYAYALMKFVDRYSKDELLSVLAFVTIGLFSFSLAGLKQVMSMALMMLAFLNFIDKKYWSTALLSIYAYWCHPVGAVFLVSFILYYMRNKKYFITLIAIFVLLISFFNMTFFENFIAMSGIEHFEMYLEEDESYSYVTLIFYLIVVGLACFGFKKYKLAEYGEARVALGFSIIACGMQFLAYYSPSMFRLAFYFTPFMMILVPNSTHYIPPTEKRIIRLAIISIIIFFHLYTSRSSAYPYSFFWQ